MVQFVEVKKYYTKPKTKTDSAGSESLRYLPFTPIYPIIIPRKYIAFPHREIKQHNYACPGNTV